jgi:hypothetical protein
MPFQQITGLQVWGTLKILLEAKFQGLTNGIESHVTSESCSFTPPKTYASC